MPTIKTEDMTNQERLDWMLERCEERALGNPSLRTLRPNYATSEIGAVRSNAELFRRGSKMEYYYAVKHAHGRITGSDLPPERYFDESDHDNLHLPERVRSNEVEFILNNGDVVSFGLNTRLVWASQVASKRETRTMYGWLHQGYKVREIETMLAEGVMVVEGYDQT